jgi:hypothetical protein
MNTMISSSRQALLAALFACLATAASAADSAKVAEAVDIATDAYIYGYSLVTTDVTRIQMSNVPQLEELKGPPNQFFNVKRYPPADFRGVSAPNADTLYSLAWIDLKEPQVFSYPDMGERYFLFPMYDLWMTDFESPGSRTTGDKAGTFLLTGPQWKGEVPEGMTHIAAKTRHMLILGRTYADGSEEDYKLVNALQAQYKITPLAAWGKPYTPVAPPVNPNPGISMTDKPQAVILGMGTEGYFSWMTKLMCEDAPPAAADAPILARMATLGIEPCKPFELGKLDPAVQAALKDLPEMALKKIGDNQASLGEKIAGWQVTKGLRVRHGLHEARGGRRLRLAGQRAGRCRVSLYHRRFKRRDPDRCQQLHDHLCQGPNAARGWFLVVHDVHDRQGLVVRPEQAQQVHGEHARQARIQ